MQHRVRLLSVAALAISILALSVGVVGAQQTTPAVVGAINGASTDPVTVAVGADNIGPLDYAADGLGIAVDPGTYDITFSGGTVDSAANVVLDPGTAATVVSGFGEDAETADAYPIEVDPIDPGMAKVAFWNATVAPVMATVGVEPAVEVLPGEGLVAQVLAAGTITVDVDGVTRDIIFGVDSYTSVFAVTDGVTPAIAISQVVSMTNLIALLGGNQVAVPDVVGLAEADAAAAIIGIGLVSGTVQAPDDTVPAGLVISQDPAAGTEVDPDTTVTITVSTGPPPPTTVAVPDVTGQSAADAQSNLEAAGFVVSVVEDASTDVEAGFVIGTNPAAGTEVAPGTAVAITVSSGPGDAVVPDLIGLSVDEATSAAEGVGLTVAFVQDPENPDPDGVVVAQDPAPGATVEAGSEITADLSPDLGAPWVIVTLDPQRQLTVSGINFLPGSTVNLSIVDSNMATTATVGSGGAWVARFDLSDVQNEAELLLVTGTAADSSDYEATFKIPAAGSSTEELSDDTDSGGVPVWGWIALAIAIIAVALIIARMVMKKDDTSPSSEPDAAPGDDTDTTPTDAT
jgi:beta-lactam-binding protein with PASTA domain